MENQTPSVIDNIFSNNLNDDITAGNLLIAFSEHLSQFISVKKENIEYKHYNNARDHSKFTRKALAMMYLCKTLLISLTQFNVFFWKLEGCVDRHAPIKKLKSKEIKLKNKPWITDRIMKMINIRNNL